MTVTPRPLSASEYRAVAQLWHDTWHEAHAAFVPPALVALRTVDDFQRRLTGMAKHVRVIGASGAPDGLCAIRTNEVDQLFVHPRARGTGAAAVLLNDAEARLRKAGTRLAELDCIPENATAIRFYTKMGWMDQGVQNIPLDTSAGPFTLRCVVFRKRLKED